MPDDRLLRVLIRLASKDGSGTTGRLCEGAAEIVEVSGAGIMLLTDDQPQGSVCTTDEVSARIEELQYTLGEGPGVDAYRRQFPVIEPDLMNPSVTRWVAFVPLAVRAGAQAVFGFPISVGDVQIGALNLYRTRAGPLTLDQHADAVIVAGVAARAIVSMQASASAGEISPMLEAVANLRLAAHRAAGMIAVQLGVPVHDALLLLRAHAFSSDRDVVAVAHDVLGRRLRLDELEP